MAKPRLFISSTYYDLRYVRADLAVLEEQMALEVVRFETGAIPYQTAETLPEAICKEIDNCNIMLSIIGGRYGSMVETSEKIPSITESNMEEQQTLNPKRKISISRMEVERAIRSGLLLFTFVDSAVLAEYRTYYKNKENANKIKWNSVDDILVFEFIGFVYNLEGRNPVFEFRNPKEIQDLLRLQLSGLFCDLLQQKKLDKYSSHIDHVIKSAEKLESLQSRLKNQQREVEERTKQMLLPDHPFFSELKEKLNSPIRIFFKNQDELFEIFQNFDFVKINPKEIQKDKAKKMLYFVKNGIDSTKQFIGISMDFFTDSGDLKLPAYPDAWNKEGIWSGNTI